MINEMYIVYTRRDEGFARVSHSSDEDEIKEFANSDNIAILATYDNRNEAYQHAYIASMAIMEHVRLQHRTTISFRRDIPDELMIEIEENIAALLNKAKEDSS